MPGCPSGPVRSGRTRSVMPSEVYRILSKCSGLKSGTQNVLLSGNGASAGFGIWLCSGPFWTLPATHVRSSKTEAGTCTPLKSSLALGLNSTRIVRSLAVCVSGAFLYSRGFFFVLAAFFSVASSWRAAMGLPPV